MYYVLFRSGRSGAAYQADQEEQDDSAQYGNDQTGKVEPCHTLRAEGVHNEATDQGTNDAHDDIGECAHSSISTHNDTCNPSSDGTEDDP